MQTDVTNLSGLLNTWIPSIIDESIKPIIDRSEQTITSLDRHIQHTIADSIAQKQVTNQHIDNIVMGKIDDRISPIETRLGALDRHITEQIDLNLIPKEAQLMIPPHTETCPPCQEWVADPVFPGQGQCVQLNPNECPAPIGTGIIDNVPIECPPVECPPPPPCPPCPDDIAPFSIYVVKCRIPNQSCCYIVGDNVPPINPDDKLVWSEEVGAAALLNAYVHILYQCLEGIPLCPIPKPPKPGGNGMLPPGICPNPIVNIQPPIGGVINNNPQPTNPIINVPSPPDGPTMPSPYPYPVPSGSFLNIQMVCAPQLPQDGKCDPSGSMAYYSLECNDDTKIKLLWSQICGKNLSDIYGEQTPVDWYKNLLDKLWKFTVDWTPTAFTPISIGAQQ